jgi:hypothetical protein
MHASTPEGSPTVLARPFADRRFFLDYRLDRATVPPARLHNDARETRGGGYTTASARLPGNYRSVMLFRRQRSFDLLAQACHCSGLFARAFCRRFFIGRPRTKLLNQAGALDRATETA